MKNFNVLTIVYLVASAVACDKGDDGSGPKGGKADLPCGDGTVALCEILKPACPDGLVREVVNQCYGECVDPDTCLPPTACGDGTVALCEILKPACPDGLVREVVDQCYGECVDPNTCEAPQCATPADCKGPVLIECIGAHWECEDFQCVQAC